MQAGDFKQIGILMAVSLVQGGSGYPFFAPAIFEYLAGTDICAITPSLQDVPSAEVQQLIAEVCIIMVYSDLSRYP